MWRRFGWILKMSILIRGGKMGAVLLKSMGCLPSCVFLPLYLKLKALRIATREKGILNMVSVVFSWRHYHATIGGEKQKHDTSYNEERTDILPQFKDETFCTISEGISNISRGFPQIDEAIKCSVSEQIDSTTQGKSGIQSSRAAYRILFENWDPLPMQAVVPDADDED
ncbi:Hypothetical predicted protein [Olea europaea subsp. europaea]|uniref:Uncharacterized protein n=1 Tax=Olea europaea subsp. europaea TaxID=158383 RepID=A0A8S0PLT7_OLEEU|nr:Hypothetical predicted protein [Olea europaea subsp. europaea]